MRQLKLRFAGPEDAKEVADWLLATPDNLFDDALLKYPTLRVISAYNGDGNVAHLPAQQVLMLESLAVRPGTPPLDAAQAFRDLVKGMELLASQLGIKELFFICKDPNVLSVAQHHGFERIEFPVVRLRL